MKEFQEFNNGNVTEVKAAISQGRATVIRYCSCPGANCLKGIVEKDDINSLYDHQTLMIVREGDKVHVCQLKSFYKKSNDNYIVIIEKVTALEVQDKLADAGIADGPIYDSAKAIFDKAVELEKKIKDLNDSKEKDEEEEGAPDDIFDIFNGKVKNKNNDDDDMPNPLDLLGKLLAVGAASKAIRKSVDPEDEKWKIFKELKEKLGRMPTFEEFTNADPSLSEEEKEKMIKTHKERESAKSSEESFQGLMTKLLESFEKDLEKLNNR